jgi:diguanylate cyclase (GGDEF)-like protein
MNAIVQIGEVTGSQTSSSDAADVAAELAALRAVVDDLANGIVVLDKDRRVQFVNRAFRRFWRVPSEVADSHQTFVKLMYHGRGINAYAVLPDQLGDYVAKQLALIRTGDERPLNIRLANGEAVQFHCKALPDGGRLLTYGNVSQLADEAETLERLACVDSLTGLNNRRHFLTLAEGEWLRFRRYGRPLALLMIDIDRFKSISNTYGHDAGDEVIKTAAEILRTYKRASDIAGRLGSEEFALMLLEATLDNAAAAAERLRQLVAERPIIVAGQRIAMTVSIGVSVCRADMGGFDELLKEADVALYEAKRSGHNRVCRSASADRPRENQAAPASDAAMAASNERESTFK